MIVAFVDDNRDELGVEPAVHCRWLRAPVFPVAVVCRLLSVSTSGFYDWRSRPPWPRSLDDEVLTEEIRHVHGQYRQTNGYRR